VVKYHGLARRHLTPLGFLMRPPLNAGTLGGRGCDRSDFMTKPSAPIGETGTPSGPHATGDRRRGSKIDMLLFVILGIVLLPAVVLNALLWLGHFLGLGVYDPAIGGDPAWRGRPLAVPLLVAVTAVVRLVVARGRWPMSPRATRALAVLVTVAVVTAAVSQIPEPSFFAN
jgi:hypothetical protein